MTNTQHDGKEAPVWNDAAEAMLHLNDIEAMLGGANGPSIRLRALFVRCVDSNADLLEALRGLEELYLREGENWNDCFERVGVVFHAETGYLRPGKDCRIHDDDVRAAAWDKWVAARVSNARAAISKAGA